MDKMLCTIRINGSDCPVTNLFDIDGNELRASDTLDMATSVVALLPNNEWLAIDVDLYDLRPLQ